MIYNIENDVIVEYSLNAKSPYYGESNNLIYAGPGCYFEQNGNTYTLLTDNNEIYEIANVSSTRIYNDKNDTAISMRTLQEKTIGLTNTLSDTNWMVNVQHPEFFNEQCRDNFGHIYGNYCGFIGLGMLVGYADKYKNDNIMDDSFYEKPNIKEGLRNFDGIGTYLYNLNPKNSTTAMHISNTMKEYAKKRNVKITKHWRLTPFFSNEMIYKAIKNDIPVELFGNFKYNDISGNQDSTGNHAIVAYGASVLEMGGGSMAFWRCHLGWRDGLYDVNISSGIIGSIYYFDV